MGRAHRAVEEVGPLYYVGTAGLAAQLAIMEPDVATIEDGGKISIMVTTGESWASRQSPWIASCAMETLCDSGR
jgi:hypothetical protein